jgi:hypothetical protein
MAPNYHAHVTALCICHARYSWSKHVTFVKQTLTWCSAHTTCRPHRISRFNGFYWLSQDLTDSGLLASTLPIMTSRMEFLSMARKSPISSVQVCSPLTSLARSKARALVIFSCLGATVVECDDILFFAHVFGFGGSQSWTVDSHVGLAHRINNVV